MFLVLMGLAAERAGWLGWSAALMVSLVAGVVATTGATLWVARWLNRVGMDHGERTEAFRAIADAMGEGVVVASPDVRLTYLNPAAETMIGRGISSSDASAWGTEYGVFRPDTITPFPTDEFPLLRALSGERTDGVESFIRNASRPEGAFLRTNGRPILDSAGRIVGGVATFRDVTDEKRVQAELAKSRALFEGLFEYAPDAVVAVDRDGRLVLVNLQAEVLFGYTKQELLGTTVEGLLPARARTSHVALRERYVTSPDRRRLPGDLIGLRKDGGEFPAAVSLGPINLASGMLVLASVRDVTEERNDKDRLHRLLSILDDREEIADVSSIESASCDHGVVRIVLHQQELGDMDRRTGR